MATDIVAQLADSLAKTGVEERELSYKGQGRKLDDAHSGESHLSPSMLCVPETMPTSRCSLDLCPNTLKSWF